MIERGTEDIFKNLPVAVFPDATPAAPRPGRRARIEAVLERLAEPIWRVLALFSKFTTRVLPISTIAARLRNVGRARIGE